MKVSKRVKSTKTADGFTKTFPGWPRSLMEGMELRLCLVTSLLSRALLRFGVSELFVRKVLDLLSFTWEMAEEFARCSEKIVRLFFVVCPIAGFQLSIGKLKEKKQ